MMRTLFISLAAAVSALAVASPAAAQWAPAPAPYGQAYGYGQGYGYGYGYGHNSRGHLRTLHVRVDQLRRTIHQLDRRNRLSNREARRLDRHAIELQRRIHSAAYRGLNRREYSEIERRIHGLHQAIRYEARDGGRWGWNGYNSYANGYGYYGVRGRDNDRRRDRGDDDRRYGDDDDRRGDRDGHRRDRDDG